jgi:hypothetical protein
MDDETRAAVERAYREHKGAEAWERETRDKLYVLLQQALKTGERGTQAELIRITEYSRERLRQIKDGKWYRSKPLR